MPTDRVNIPNTHKLSQIPIQTVYHKNFHREYSKQNRKNSVSINHPKTLFLTYHDPCMLHLFPISPNLSSAVLKIFMVSIIMLFSLFIIINEKHNYSRNLGRKDICHVSPISSLKKWRIFTIFTFSSSSISSFASKKRKKKNFFDCSRNTL